MGRLKKGKNFRRRRAHLAGEAEEKTSGTTKGYQEMNQVEVPYTCPYCFTDVTLLVDTSVGQQQYVEDCERCCNPIEFSVRCQGGAVTDLEVQPLGQ